MTLADPDLIDLVISAGYLVCIGLCIAATVMSTARSSRFGWLAVGAFLLMLLFNQQSDIHVRLLHWGSDELEARGWDLLDPRLLAIGVTGLALACLVAVLVGWWLLHNDLPPGGVALTGLLLLVVHGLGRSGQFMHVFWDEWADEQLPWLFKSMESAGLLLMAFGSVLWIRSHRSPAGSTHTDSDGAIGVPTFDGADLEVGSTHPH